MADPTKRCSVEGCANGGRLKRGMCSMHYQREMKDGDPGSAARQIAPHRFPAPVGETFGCWTVLGEAPTRVYRDASDERTGSQHVRYWNVRCVCGYEGERVAQNIKSGKSKSCGCRAAYKRRLAIPVGERFGKLTVVGEGERSPAGYIRWLCRCDCGNEISIVASDLKRQDLRANHSCGCTRRIHNLASHPLYSTWNNILERCLNPACPSYYNYGATGVTVCERWADRKTGLAAFIADMGDKPGPGYSIDRENSTGPYAPDNCRWATRKQQRANQRRLPRVRVDLLRMAARDVGIDAADLDAALALIARWAPNIMT